MFWVSVSVRFGSPIQNWSDDSRLYTYLYSIVVYIGQVSFRATSFCITVLSTSVEFVIGAEGAILVEKPLPKQVAQKHTTDLASVTKFFPK